jgi:hypothetical protein
LKVCARANDLDALWGIAAKIPEKGKNAANHVTYTIILNAITMSLLVNPPLNESVEQRAARIDRGVLEGRRIWQEVIGKWKNGNIKMNEELVCAMGRMLLTGSRPRDWDDVLSLVEQTMDIVRQAPRLEDRKSHGLPHIRAPNVPDEFRFDDDHLGPGDPPARGDEFLPVSRINPDKPAKKPLEYATPGRNTLSMVTEACQKIVALKAATAYWTLLTHHHTYNIMPDINNVHQYLRVLRQSRSSAEVAKFMR